MLLGDRERLPRWAKSGREFREVGPFDSASRFSFLIFFFAVPFSQLVNYDLIIFGLLHAFAQVAGFDHSAALIEDRTHLDFVRWTNHNGLLTLIAP